MGDANVLHSLLCAFQPCSCPHCNFPAVFHSVTGNDCAQMFAQQLCTCLPVGQSRNSFCQGLLVGPEEKATLATPRISAVALSLAPICSGSDEENFPQNILPWERPYDNSYHSCFFLCKCGYIFHSWKRSENCSWGTKFQ